MPLKLAVKASEEVRKQREEAVLRAVAHFECLPDRRLLCFFDDRDWPFLRGHGMAANRGAYFHAPPWQNTPLYVREQALVAGQPVFDELIYLHGSTCSSHLGLTMTFAHELQHFVQHSTTPSLWAANTLAYVMLRDLENKDFKALGLRTCDIPFEREARIVAKRVAEDLFGAGAVHQHIEAKIVERVTEQDATDWDCIRSLAVPVPYDLASETERFFPMLRRQRAELERALRSLQSTDVVFGDVDLNALLSGPD